jgi:hypothetical protein
MNSTLATFDLTTQRLDPSVWVQVDQLCDAIAVEFGFRPCEKTVIRWRKDGCPHLPLSYRRIRYQVAEVVQWLLQRKVQGKPQRSRRSLGRCLS